MCKVIQICAYLRYTSHHSKAIALLVSDLVKIPPEKGSGLWYCICVSKLGALGWACRYTFLDRGSVASSFWSFARDLVPTIIVSFSEALQCPRGPLKGQIYRVIQMCIRYLDMTRETIVDLEAAPSIGGKIVSLFAGNAVPATIVSFAEVPRCPCASLGIVKMAKLYKSMIICLGLSHVLSLEYRHRVVSPAINRSLLCCTVVASSLAGYIFYFPQHFFLLFMLPARKYQSSFSFHFVPS